MNSRIPRLLPRSRQRRLLLGLATVLGLAPRGFFIPYRYRKDAPQALPPYLPVLRLFREHHDPFLDLLAGIDAFAAELLRIDGEAPPSPRWNQDWFPRLDAAVAYTIVRKMQPARILEVGAGHSTRFLARAVADGGLDTLLTTIDPAPRARLDGLDVRIINKTLEQAGERPFLDLDSGDILSIDSSHVLMPGTDVDILLNRILPHLPSGLVVHFHDIFLPDGYPEAWGWRGYNEQLGVATLLHGGEWRVLWSSHYVGSRMAAAVARTVAGRLILLPEALESSLWLEKRRGADRALQAGSPLSDE